MIQKKLKSYYLEETVFIRSLINLILKRNPIELINFF